MPCARGGSSPYRRQQLLSTFSAVLHVRLTLSAENRPVIARRWRRPAATMALILLVPGGASAALADSEGEASRTGAPVNRQGPLDGGAGASRVAHRRRLVEEAWLSEQHRCGDPARDRPPRRTARMRCSAPWSTR